MGNSNATLLKEGGKGTTLNIEESDKKALYKMLGDVSAQKASSFLKKMSNEYFASDIFMKQDNDIRSEEMNTYQCIEDFFVNISGTRKKELNTIAARSDHFMILYSGISAHKYIFVSFKEKFHSHVFSTLASVVDVEKMDEESNMEFLLTKHEGLSFDRLIKDLEGLY